MIDTHKIMLYDLYERGQLNNQLSNDEIAELFHQFAEAAGGASELLKILLTK